MRSTVSIKGMILVLVIFFIGVSSLFYFFLYLPKMTKARKDKRTLSSLNAKVEHAIQELNETQGEIERFNREDFKRQHIPSEEQIPTFLENINGLARRLGFKTNEVKPLDKEESSDYIRYPFLVQTESKYREIVTFIDSLENSFGLNLDDLHIENNPKAPESHLLRFTVSTFELTRAESAPPDKSGKEQAVRPQIVVRDIAVKRDPFLEKKEKKKVAAVSKRKKGRKRSPPLKLNGIIDIAGKRIAIVNDKIVREGDEIASHRILKIEEDEVIVVYGGKERTLRVKELVKTK